MNRRSCLKAFCVTSSIGVSGCFRGDVDDPQTSDLYTDVSVEATVEDAASESNPARISLDLLNEGTQELEIYPLSRSGNPLEWIGELDGASSQAMLVSVGGSNVRVIDGELPSERESGCWRYPSDEEFILSIDEVKESVSLAHEERFSSSHDLYYDGEEDQCYPDDQYEATVGIEYSAHDVVTQAEFALAVSPPPESQVEITTTSFEERE